MTLAAGRNLDDGWAALRAGDAAGARHIEVVDLAGSHVRSPDRAPRDYASAASRLDRGLRRADARVLSADGGATDNGPSTSGRWPGGRPDIQHMGLVLSGP